MYSQPKVLYITYDGLTDPLGQSQIIPYLNGLAAKGYQIFILSFEKEKAYKNNKQKVTKILYSSIQWIPRKYHKSPSVPATFYDLLTGISTALFYCTFKKINIIHCRGHIVTTMIASFVSRFFTLKFLFDMRGFWVDERIEGGIWSLKNPLHRNLYSYFKNHERKVLNQSDHIVVLTYRARNYLLDNYKINKNKISVIPCMADLDLFKFKGDEIRSQIRHKLNINDEFVLTYLGSLGTWYMTEEILDFFLVLKELTPAKMVFLTPDSTHTIYQFMESKNIRKEDVTVKFSSRKEVPEYLSASDAGIFFIRPTFSKIASSPTKHAEFLGCGLPVVCNSQIGDIDVIVNESKSGVIVETFDTLEYKSKAIALLNLWKNNDRAVMAATAKKYYDLDKGLKEYERIYKLLSSN